MKSLYLLRHATPADAGPGQSDVARPLHEHGRQEAAAIGARLRTVAGARGPSLVLCSTAQRTIDTLDEVRPFLARSVCVSLEEELYCADCNVVLGRVTEVEDEHESLLVIGHNPGIAILTTTLAGAGDPEVLERALRQYPPGTLARIDFECAMWSQVSPKNGTLIDFTTPSTLVRSAARLYTE